MSVVRQETISEFIQPIEPVLELVDRPIETSQVPTEEITQLPKWKLELFFGAMIVCDVLAEHTILDKTKRVLGRNALGEIIETEYYKPRTMPVQNEIEKAILKQKKADGTFIKGVDDKRTRLGSVIELFKIDEIFTTLLYPGLNVIKKWGNSRMIMMDDTKNPLFIQALEERGKTMEDFFDHYDPGGINIPQAFGITELKSIEDHQILMKSVFMEKDDPEYPSKFKMVYGTVRAQSKKIFQKIKSKIT